MRRQARIDAYVAQAKAEILEDCANGTVIGEEVKCFADLHDYADANMYGGAAELLDELGTAMSISILNEGQTVLDEWIKGGALAYIVDGKVVRALGRNAC